MIRPTSMTTRRTASALVLAAVLAAGADARADDGKSEGARAEAAAAFDDGVARAACADYEGATRAFLRADELVPSTQALANALAAARKAGDHLVVAHAAERAAARAATDPDLAARARAALAEAATHLARIETTCDAADCTLTVDGFRTPPGRSFVLPGTHELTARAAAGGSATERITFAAGATYRLVLHPVSPGAPAVRADLARSGERITFHDGGPEIPLKPPRVDPAHGERLAPSSTTSGLSPAWFFVGLGTTALLGGLTTWSGLDTLAAKRGLSAEPTEAAVQDVKGRMARSDGFFVGCLVSAAATTLVGLIWVDWHPSRGHGVKASARSTAAAPGRFAW